MVFIIGVGMVFKASIRNLVVVSIISVLVACGGAEERKLKYLTKGKTYFEENNFDKARVEFKNVLQIDPKSADPYYYLGRIEEKNKELPKAIANYRKAGELDPGHFKSRARLARLYTVIGTEEYIGKAEELLKTVLASDPTNSDALLTDSTITMIKGDKDAAEDKLKHIISQNKELPEAYSLLASVYSVQGRDVDAERILADGIKGNPDSVGLRLLLAKQQLKKDPASKDAEQQLVEIIRIEPDEYNYRAMLANYYSRTGNNGKAEEVLRQAIMADSKDTKRYAVLVQFLARTKSIAEAETELKNALKKNPDLVDLKFALSAFYQETGQIDKAIDTLREAIQNDESDQDVLRARIALAKILYDQKKITDAGEIVNKVLEENPTNPDAQFLKAKLDLVFNEYDAAINNLRSVLKSEPKNDEAALMLAQAHVRNSQDELAQDVLVKIIEIDPLNVKNHINYANYVASKKDYIKANDIIEKALTYFKDNYDLLDMKYKLTFQGGDVKAAEKVLNDMAESYQDSEKVYMERGRFYASQGAHDRAIQELETALRHTNNPYPPLEAIIRIYIKAERNDDALAYLNRRIKDGKDTVAERVLLGQVHMASADQNRALVEFNNAIEKSNWEVPYLNVAAVHISKKEFGKAIAVLKLALTKVKNLNSIQMKLASLYERQGDYKQAMYVYSDILDTNPANQLAANNLASLLVDYSAEEENGNTRALELVKVFEHLAHPAFQDTVGWVYLKNNRVEEALSTLKQVVDKAPKVAIFQYHLGVAYKQSGDTKNARVFLAKAVESEQHFADKESARELLETL